MIYIVNGAPGCGKTTFEKMCSKLSKGGAVVSISTIDFVKKIAKSCGWDGTKTFENRRFLSDLKLLLAQWGNIPYKRTIASTEAKKYDLEELGLTSDNYIIFIDCREPEEITKLKIALSAKTILVRRLTAEAEETSNIADADVLNYEYDIVIDNNGTIDDLKNEVKRFLKENASCMFSK